MNDVSVMPGGIIRTDIMTLPRAADKRSNTSRSDGFASILDRYDQLSSGNGERQRTRSGNPLSRLLTLVRKPDEDTPPDELAAIAGASLQNRTESVDPLDTANDMEVNSALAFTDPDVQDELTALFLRIAGEKESGVFLRILDKLFEQQRGLTGETPLFSGLLEGFESGDVPNGLLAALDKMIESLNARINSEMSFVTLPGDFDITGVSISREPDGPVAPLLPLLQELRARILADAGALTQEATPDDSSISGAQNLNAAPVLSGDDENLSGDARSDDGKSTAETYKTLPFSSHLQSAAGVSDKTGFEPVIQRAGVAHVLEQISESVLANRNGGVTKLELQLNPEFLGKVSVVLTSSPDGMSASLKSSSEATRVLLAENIAALQNTLRDMGINMKNIEVVQPGITGDFSGGRNQNREQHPEASGENRIIRNAGRNRSVEGTGAAPELITAAGTIYNVSGMYADGASVDYRA